MRYLWAVLIFFCITGCTRQEVKDIVRDKHALLYVFCKRFDNPDPAKRPTYEECESMLRATLKDYESFDKAFNNWTDGKGGMRPVDIDRPAKPKQDVEYE